MSYISVDRILIKLWPKDEGNNTLWADTRHAYQELRYGDVRLTICQRRFNDVTLPAVSVTHGHFWPVKKIYKIPVVGKRVSLRLFLLYSVRYKMWLFYSLRFWDQPIRWDMRFVFSWELMLQVKGQIWNICKMLWKAWKAFCKTLASNR